MNSFILLLFYLFNDIFVSGLTKSSLEILFFNIFFIKDFFYITFLFIYFSSYFIKKVLLVLIFLL